MIKETGGPAFPNASIKTKDGIDVWGDGGMTLRDYFAAKALGSCGFTTKPYNTTTETAEKCYAMADAMLKARKQ